MRAEEKGSRRGQSTAAAVSFLLVDNVAVQERYDLCAGAGILRAEFRRTHTVRNAVLDRSGQPAAHLGYRLQMLLLRSSMAIGHKSNCAVCLYLSTSCCSG